MAFEIIPAIDIRGGRCVRLYQGDYDRETVYGEDPVEMARRWEGCGASRIHVVDLDAARSGDPVNLGLVAGIAAAVAVPIQLGGGVRDREGVLRALEAGVQRAIIGTRAARDPDAAAELFREFGESLVLGLDARDGKVAAAGWREVTRWDAVEFGRLMEAAGVTRAIFTDVATDGTGQGPSLEATNRLLAGTSLRIIASGGVGNLGHIRSLLSLAEEWGARLEGVIAGKALYAGTLDLAEGIAVTRGRA